MKERWRPVVGFEGLYEVSDQGRVRGLDRLIAHPRGGVRRWPGRVLRACVMPHGYLEVSLCKDGTRTLRTVHSVVAEAFHGPAPAGHEVAHENGRRADCRASNLSWKTRKDNHADKIRHGTTNRGERQWKSKLTKARVLLARRLAAEGVSQGVLGERFGVNRETIGKVVRRETWAHI